MKGRGIRNYGFQRIKLINSLMVNNKKQGNAT